MINYYKWEALINFLREKKEKTCRREKRKQNKKDRTFARKQTILVRVRFRLRSTMVSPDMRTEKAVTDNGSPSKGF